MQITSEQVNPRYIKRGDFVLIDGFLMQVLESVPAGVMRQYIRFQNKITNDMSRVFNHAQLITKLSITLPTPELKANRSMKVKSIQVFLNIGDEFPPHCHIVKHVIPREFDGEYALKHPDTIYKTIAQVIKLEENEEEVK